MGPFYDFRAGASRAATTARDCFSRVRTPRHFTYKGKERAITGEAVDRGVLGLPNFEMLSNEETSQVFGIK